MRTRPLAVLFFAAAVAQFGRSAKADPWRAEIVDRLRDGMRAFHADGEGWAATSPETGLRGSFDLRDARLTHAGARLAVRTARWGRAGEMKAAAPSAPQLGDCADSQEDPTGACIRRLELQSAGLTESWSSTRDGFEQSWTVDAPPVGAGDLLLEVAVQGADVDLGDHELWLDGQDGDSWVVDGFEAWDAEGAPLPLDLVATTSGFRIVLQDRGARYPVTIDPVYSPTATTLTGDTDGDYLGWSVSGAGDVNGDGYDDVIVGACGVDGGRAYLYYGSADGVSSTAGTTLIGEDDDDGFGWSVAGAGDVNGDGYDDVIVGTYNSGADRVYVFHGSACGLSTTAATTLSEGGARQEFGISLAGAGDVNGDGYDDVIVGEVDPGSGGAAYVYLGSASGVGTSASSVFSGREADSDFGTSVAGAGDVNNDGYDDVIVGDALVDSFEGRAYVYLGSASGVSSPAATTLTGEAEGGVFGDSVSGAGDVNGDGYDDVIVGAGDDLDEAGAVYVYLGSSGGIPLTAATVLAGEESGDAFGGAVSTAGDVNGDGYADIVVGADEFGGDTGRAYIYPGMAAGVSSTAVATFTGEAASDKFGRSVSSAGDVDGDGYSDIIVGTRIYDDAPGRAYLYLSGGESTASGLDSGGCDTGTPDTADSDGASSEDDTDGSSADTGPAKTSPGCGCATTRPDQGVLALAVLGLLVCARRTRS